mmetsp:Transcript_20927/g.52413  ORF Transcript_20927/g.52413 Transcript_20927/m.52413 type:complete len:305 (+) Transcript_20927:492-1406(+)
MAPSSAPHATPGPIAIASSCRARHALREASPTARAQPCAGSVRRQHGLRTSRPRAPVSSAPPGPCVRPAPASRCPALWATSALQAASCQRLARMARSGRSQAQGGPRTASRARRGPTTPSWAGRNAPRARLVGSRPAQGSSSAACARAAPSPATPAPQFALLAQMRGLGGAPRRTSPRRTAPRVGAPSTRTCPSPAAPASPARRASSAPSVPTCRASARPPRRGRWRCPASWRGRASRWWSTGACSRNTAPAVRAKTALVPCRRVPRTGTPPPSLAAGARKAPTRVVRSASLAKVGWMPSRSSS